MCCLQIISYQHFPNRETLNMKIYTRNGGTIIFIFFLFAKAKSHKREEKHPNIVMIIADDLGIGDIGCYGNNTIKTPNIDKLAEEGIKLNHHLAVEALCTPSRAALLTGRYPARFGLTGDKNTPPVVVHVASKVGLPHSEITIAEAFSSSNYSTAITGKWHLGSDCGLFGTNCLGPLAHGFDVFYGLIFTLVDDMEKNFPFWVYNLNDTFYQAHLSTFLLSFVMTFCLWRKNWLKLSIVMGLYGLVVFFALWFMYSHYRLHTAKWWQVSPWMDNNLNGVIVNNGKVVHRRVPFQTIFQEFVNQSVDFIRASSEAGRPFFLVHSFAHVHVPLFASNEFTGRSKHGRYGDNVEEMDSGVGAIMNALKKYDLDDNTVVYFVSDHGGHLEAIDPEDGQRLGGYNKNFKGGKGMGAAEGGIRVPGIFRWKGVIPSNSVVDTPTSLLDIFPTLLDLAGLPKINKIYSQPNKLDGISFAHLLKEPNTNKDLERILVHHCGREIHGLRMIKDSKIYKMYLHIHKWKANSSQCGWGNDVLCGCFNPNNINLTQSPLLYELISDPYEDDPIQTQTEEYKLVIKEMMSYLKKWKKDNPYPPSLLSSRMDTVLSPWLQPF